MTQEAKDKAEILLFLEELLAELKEASLSERECILKERGELLQVLAQISPEQ